MALADIHLRFAWQAWHLETSTLVLRGRCGTRRHPPSFCVAGVALMALRGALGRRWSPVTPRHFAWQAWHLETSTFVLRCRRRTRRHSPLVCVAGVALMALRGRAWSPLVAGDAAAPHCHSPSLSHHLSHTALSPTIFHTRLCHTPSLTHPLSHTILVTHTHHLSHHLSHTIFHTTLSHTIFHTPLLSHTTLSHTILHTPLCHTPSFTTPSFTHNFVAHHFSPHHLSHTTLPHTIVRHTIFHTQLCHTPSFTHSFVTHHL